MMLPSFSGHALPFRCTKMAFYYQTINFFSLLLFYVARVWHDFIDSAILPRSNELNLTELNF